VTVCKYQRVEIMNRQCKLKCLVRGGKHGTPLSRMLLLMNEWLYTRVDN
jgi:hypothetical protein